MIVKSALADLNVTVGRMKGQAGHLVLESGEDSSLQATVTMTPADVASALAAFLRSPSAWLFMLSLPFAGLRSGGNQAEASRYPGFALNHPWLDQER
jgi:hypothetical protein